MTAEVSPHHMAFDHTAAAATDSNFKVMPPLREPSDREALVAGLVEGVIDAVATDHAPHAALEKEVPFEEAPNGILGLEWAASIAIGVAGLTQEAFFDRMSIPASCHCIAFPNTAAFSRSEVTRHSLLWTHSTAGRRQPHSQRAAMLRTSGWI